MNSATVLAPKQALTNLQAIFWGGLIAGILDAIDGVIAYGTQGLNPVQVCNTSRVAHWENRPTRMASPLLPSAQRFHFIIAWVAAAVFVLASQRLQMLKTHALLAGLLYGAAVYFFMNYLVLPLSAVVPPHSNSDSSLTV